MTSADIAALNTRFDRDNRLQFSAGEAGMVKVDITFHDATLELYQRAAVAQATAGAHVVAPSGMMDGQVAAIRAALDEARVALVPGEPFGEDRCVRLSFATSMAQIDEGLDRLSAMLMPAE